MDCRVRSTNEIKLVQSANSVPADGEYTATWCGYHIRYWSGVIQYHLQTEVGVRGMVPCMVRVTDGVARAMRGRDS